MKRGKERNEGTKEPAFAGRQVNNRTALDKNKPDCRILLSRAKIKTQQVKAEMKQAGLFLSRVDK